MKANPRYFLKKSAPHPLWMGAFLLLNLTNVPGTTFWRFGTFVTKEKQ